MLSSRLRIKEGMVWFKSGHFYSFHYKQYANDPIPTVIMLNHVSGTHENTGHKHNYIQCINLSYIPRNFRKKFVNAWLPALERNRGNVRLTWDIVVKKWPFLTVAIRRYIVRRNLIMYAREIPFDKVMEEVISTSSRDFSRASVKRLVEMTDRLKKRNPVAHKNLFARNLSKYLYKYRAQYQESVSNLPSFLK